MVETGFSESVPACAARGQLSSIGAPGGAGPRVPEPGCWNELLFKIFLIKPFCCVTFPLGSILQTWE